jgi:hypothetical protein
VVLGVLNPEVEGQDEAAAAEGLLAAGAVGVFRSTVEAVDWCIANADANAAASAGPLAAGKFVRPCCPIKPMFRSTNNAGVIVPTGLLDV